MICPNCGKEYSDKLIFCVSCGTKLVHGGKLSVEKEKPEIVFDENQTTLFTMDDNKSNYESKDIDNELDNMEFSHIYAEKAEEPEENDFEEKECSDVRMQSIASLIARNFVSLLIALCTIFVIVLGVTTFSLRQALKKDALTTITDSNDILNLPISDFASNSGVDYSAENQETVLDSIYYATKDYGVSREEIVAIYESPAFQNFMKENISGFSEYFLNGYTDKTISVEKLKNLYTDNIDTMNEILGVELSQDDINCAFGQLDQSTNAIEVFSVRQIEKSSSSKLVGIIRAFISFPAIIIEAILVISLLGILLTMQKKVVPSLRWLGIPFIISGGVIAGATLLISSRLIFYYNYTDTQRFIITSLCDLAKNNMYIIGLVIMTLGFILMITSSLIKRATNKVS